MDLQNRIQILKQKFKKFKENYSLLNCDPNSFDQKTLKESIKHESNSLVLDILSISVCSIIFYFIVRYQLVLIPFSNTYTFFTIQRDFAILLGYIFSWINVILMVIGIFREILFMNKILERENPSKRIKLTIEDNKNNNDSDFSSNKEKHIKKLGEIETDKPLINILIFNIIIVIIIIEMTYYLPFKSRFPHYSEPFAGVGQIYVSEYLIFLVIMLVFAIGKIFLIIMNIMGTIHRKTVFNTILYKKVQNDYFKELDSKNQSDPLLKTEKPPVQELITSKIEKDSENQITFGRSGKISILNTPIEMVKLYNLKKIQIKKQMAYLKERETLLNLMNEEKLKNLYGKKGFKEYKKELKRAKKKGYKTIADGEGLGQQKLSGYKIVENNSVISGLDMDQTKNEELSKSSKEIRKDKKNNTKKQKYDFR